VEVIQVSSLLKSNQNAGAGLRRICTHGLDSARVRALGHLLGKRFYLIVAKDEGELFSALDSDGRVNGLVLSTGLPGSDLVGLIHRIRSIEAARPGKTTTPIFVFSSLDVDQCDQGLEELGVQGVFQKPGDIWKLAEAIHGYPVVRDRMLNGPAFNGPAFGLGPEAMILGAMNYIEQNLVGIRNSAEVSKHLRITREHLSRQFTKYTGQTLWDFVSTCRIYRAKVLLTNSDLLIKQISREVGFNCESSFFRAFARKTKLTPEGFRCKISRARGKG